MRAEYIRADIQAVGGDSRSRAHQRTGGQAVDRRSRAVPTSALTRMVPLARRALVAAFAMPSNPSRNQHGVSMRHSPSLGARDH